MCWQSVISAQINWVHDHTFTDCYNTDTKELHFLMSKSVRINDTLVGI